MYDEDRGHGMQHLYKHDPTLSPLWSIQDAEKKHFELLENERLLF